MKNLWRKFRALSWKQQAGGWVAAFVLLAIVVQTGDAAETTRVAEELEAEVASVATTTLTAPDTTASPSVQEATTTVPLTATTTQTNPTDAPTTTVVLTDAFMILEIVVFDWTENIPYGQIGPVAIGVGFESWEPDMEFGGDFKEFGEYEIGVPSSFEFYPDGFGGRQIIVDFVMTDEMTSGSVMSQTHVEIYDNEVLAWGQAIPGFEVTYDR